MAERAPELLVADSNGWSEWLTSHSGQPDGVRLVLAKKGKAGATTLTYQEALEEALCHGWIDGQAGPRDGATFSVRFTPRRSRSAWSKRNVGIAERLMAEGRMRERGFAEVERAKADGRWEAAYALASTVPLPPDLEAALGANRAANERFSTLRSQNRNAILYRVQSARRPETRARRIAEFVEMLARGETIYPERPTTTSRRPSSAKPSAERFRGRRR